MERVGKYYLEIKEGVFTNKETYDLIRIISLTPGLEKIKEDGKLYVICESSELTPLRKKLNRYGDKVQFIFEREIRKRR